MLKIEGKTFMNIQEAVQWLLDNNALPFQCTANYQANTEIGLGTIVNPTPAKVRIGSLIFFADSKVSTVVGITETGFICSDKYNNLVDDIAYVTNIAINASGHLITTLSDGQIIDAGIVKQVSDFSINASQHLVVSYNDGTTTDLGAIFSGNVNIAGTLNAVAVTGNSIIETMTGYSASAFPSPTGMTVNHTYVSACKNGNKVTFVWAGNIVTSASIAQDAIANLCYFNFPDAIGQALYPIIGTQVAYISVLLVENRGVYKKASCIFQKNSNSQGYITLNFDEALDANKTYYIRLEFTFLLNNSLI